jgi:hypothetical protein
MSADPAKLAADLLTAGVNPERLADALRAVEAHSFTYADGTRTYTDVPGAPGSLVSRTALDSRMIDPAEFINGPMRALVPELFAVPAAAQSVPPALETLTARCIRLNAEKQAQTPLAPKIDTKALESTLDALRSQPWVR